MLSFLSYLSNYKRNEDGATAIEYSLLAAGVALAIAAVVYLLGDELLALYGDVLAMFTG